MSAGQPSTRPCRLGGNLYRGGSSARGFESDEVGNGSRRGSAAEGAILEIRLTLRMVMVSVMGRDITRVGRTELQQERGAARGHEPDWDIGTKDERGQQYDGQHIGSPGVTEPSLHDCGSHDARVSAIVPVGAVSARRRTRSTAAVPAI